MPDPLYFSAWLKGFSPLGLPIYFKKALETFPASQLFQGGGVLRVYAVSDQEPPVLEESFDRVALDWEEVVSRARQFLHEDSSFQFETAWDLWQWDQDWALKPAPALISCHGPLFGSNLGENLSIEFPDESLFLPHPTSDQLRPVQSNLRSLVRLAAELEENLPMAKRTLWSENHENFADLVADLVS